MPTLEDFHALRTAGLTELHQGLNILPHVARFEVRRIHIREQGQLLPRGKMKEIFENFAHDSLSRRVIFDKNF